MRQGILFRVSKGRLEPLDDLAVSALRAGRYRVGDVVEAKIKRARNPNFHRLAHQIGLLCIRNIDKFGGYTDAHAVLKRLQVESGAGCDEMLIEMPGIGVVIQRIPKSLSFSSMGEEEFRGFVAAICRHIESRYWPSVDADKIEAMAEAMVDE